MRAARIFWAALGAIAATLIFAFANWYLTPTTIHDRTVAYLFLPSPIKEKGIETGVAPSKSEFNVFRLCGARKIEILTPGDAQPMVPTVPLVRQNYSSLECIIESARKNNLHLGVKYRWAHPDDVQ
ncbi:MAG: hypothetical protein JOZ79_02270 [Sphingomonas sp.]|nr:hypothetical protein [Sphingomonas sp.]